MYRTSYRSILTSRGPSYLPTSNQRSILQVILQPTIPLHPAGASSSRQCSGHASSRQCSGHLWKSVGLRQRPALIGAASGRDFGRVRALIFGWIGPRFLGWFSVHFFGRFWGRFLTIASTLRQSRVWAIKKQLPVYPNRCDPPRAVPE